MGSWLLCHRDEALLLEVPKGLPVAEVKAAVYCLGVSLRFVTASHDHEDHLDVEVWKGLQKAFPETTFIHPRTVAGDSVLYLDGEPVWLVKAPKHSRTDVVTIFRGVAMTGDIELGMLESVNNEVTVRTRRRSMGCLRDFSARTGYHVHSLVSAHLNDVRTSIDWPQLFTV